MRVYGENRPTQNAETWPPHAFMDADGTHVVFSHRCNGLIRTTQLPHPQWHAENGAVTPSIKCNACGFHDTLAVGI